jgi:Cu+-exporting ATPase
MGITATIENSRVLIGNTKLMKSYDISFDESISSQFADAGKTPLFIAKNDKYLGIISVADTIKSGSALAISTLIQMGIEPIMMTGDDHRTATAIAKQAGIERIVAEVLPGEKSEEIKKIQSAGKCVAMVGDGINDAPALTQADIGIAIGTGTDVAIESADIVLMRGDLSDVPTALKLSRSTLRNIKENLGWAFGYNIIGIPIAAGLLYLIDGKSLLNPMIGAAAMSFSSVSVLLNALRLRFFKKASAKQNKTNISN